MTEWMRLTKYSLDIVHEWCQDGWILAKFSKMQRTIIVMIKTDNDDDDKDGKSF